MEFLSQMDKKRKYKSKRNFNFFLKFKYKKFIINCFNYKNKSD